MKQNSPDKLSELNQRQKKTVRHLLGLAIAIFVIAITAVGQSVPSFAPPVNYPAPGASAAAAGGPLYQIMGGEAPRACSHEVSPV